MTWWVIVGLGHEPGYTDLRVYASTNNPDHLFMSWATYRPAQHEIWRIVRGKRVFCGYNYVWDTPNLAEQLEEGDTLVHRFYISGITDAENIWYYLHAPSGPAGREIQGPLTHVFLLRLPTWAHHAYFASRSKGMFKTTDLSGPGGPQPTWVPDNGGLPFLDIRQLCPDPWDRYHRRFIICHGDVYRLDNFLIQDPTTATRVLTNAQAVALTGGLAGAIDWIANSPNYLGHFYVLFRRTIPEHAHFCIKTQNYGASWTAHTIQNILLSYNSGNIMAGDLRGESPHPAGDVLYACYTGAALGNPDASVSFDEGTTWSILTTFNKRVGTWEPRLYVDPADQGTVYLGASALSDELWRSLDHGATWALCDAGNRLGPCISPLAAYSIMHTRRSDPNAIRVLDDRHIWKSSDFGIIWRDQGHNQYSVRHLYWHDHSPDFLYLARIINAPLGDGIYAPHVIFVSMDEGSNMFGKAGDHPHFSDGGGDSIPYDCGGAAHDGILTLP